MQDPYLPEGYSQDDIDRRLEMMANGELPTPDQVYGREGAKSAVEPDVILPDIRDKLQICPDCGGDGWTSEHDPNDPHENGCSNCPIQVQCDTCQATGMVYKDETKKRKETKEPESDLPF